MGGRFTVRVQLCANKDRARVGRTVDADMFGVGCVCAQDGQIGRTDSGGWPEGVRVGDAVDPSLAVDGGGGSVFRRLVWTASSC